jgi:predicted DNA-binding transcriptional regulator AlpA
MATPNTLEELLNEHDVARLTGLSVATVRRWRLLRQGPRYIKIGAAVRYKAEDISAWLGLRPTGGGNQTEGRRADADTECGRRNKPEARGGIPAKGSTRGACLERAIR